MKKVNRNNRAIDVTTVGGRIKKLRTDAGFTQEDTADLMLLAESGIPATFSSMKWASDWDSPEEITRLK